MPGPFIFIATNRPRDGKFDAEQQQMPELAGFIEAHEPRCRDACAVEALIAAGEFGSGGGSRSPAPRRLPAVARARLRALVIRLDGGVEHPGSLAGAKPENVTRDEHRPLAGREELEGGDEGERDRLAGLEAPWVAAGLLTAVSRRSGGGSSVLRVLRGSCPAPMSMMAAAMLCSIASRLQTTDRLQPRQDAGSHSCVRLAPAADSP